MKNRSNSLFWGLGLITAACYSGAADPTASDTSESTSCSKDIDCKGDRICIDGLCETPSEPEPEPEPECLSDEDCPAESFCINSMCTDLGATDSPCFEMNGNTVCTQPTDPGGAGDDVPAGAVPEPPGDLPDSKSLNLTGFMIRNQGSCGSCVAFAARSVMGLRSTIQTNEFIDFSPAHIWDIAGYGSESCDVGSVSAVVFSNNRDMGVGVVPEALWPYNPTDPESSLDMSPPVMTLTAGGIAHIQNYVSIEKKSVEQIKWAIAQSWPPIISVPVYSQEWQDGSVTVPDEDASLSGFHAIAVVAYDDGAGEFRFANSWGTSYGDQGFGTMSYDFVEGYGRGGIALQTLSYSDDGVVCGDGACEESETQDSCCLDCGCPGNLQCEAGNCVENSSCGDGVADPGEQCDTQDLNGQTCVTQGFESGTLSCKGDCTFSTVDCCSDECSQGSQSCSDSDEYVMCGQFDSDICYEFGTPVSCEQGQECSSGDCGCFGGDKSQFSILSNEYPSFGPPGCSGNGTLKLKASAKMVNASTLRVYVRKEDDTSFGEDATLRLYVGDGPTCPNPPNVEKTTKAVQVGQVEQTLDLTVNPYGASWPLDETKTFWVGKDEGNFESFRATNLLSVKRVCIP